MSIEDTLERKRVRAESTKQKSDPAKISELKEKYWSNIIPSEEISVREDKHHTFHTTCNTDLVPPSKNKLPDINIFKAISSGRDEYHGALYCPTCDRIHVYYRNH